VENTTSKPTVNAAGNALNLLPAKFARLETNEAKAQGAKEVNQINEADVVDPKQIQDLGEIAQEICNFTPLPE